MRIVILITSILTSYFCLIHMAYGQYQLAPEVFAASGGVEQVTGYTMSFTFGEPITSTINLESIMLTQGFQQCDPISTSIVETLDASSIEIFPNPTSGWLTILTSNYAGNQLQVDIIDMTGKLVISQEMTSIGDRIDIDALSLAVGMYTVFVITPQEQIGHAKFIKR